MTTVGDIRSLKQVILDQFGCVIVSFDLAFDVGYFQGNKRIWIGTETDLTELHGLLKSKGATLWCDGKGQQTEPSSRHAKGKRGAITVDSSESEEEVPN